jgi:hypothetical protein
MSIGGIAPALRGGAMSIVVASRRRFAAARCRSPRDRLTRECPVGFRLR